ncbi:hypothetical protein CU098_002002, partial [Rhizopus stolonifer]
MGGLKHLDLERTRDVILETLDLLILDVFKGKPYLPHLEFSHITDCSYMDDGDNDVALISSIKTHTGLCELLMEPCKLSDRVMKAAARYLVNVKRIKLERNVSILVDFICSLVDCCPQLAYIAFSNLTLIFENLKKHSFYNEASFQLNSVNVLLVGQVYTDIILTVDHFPEEDSKLRASGTQQRRGGNCLNTAEVLCQFPRTNIFLMSALGPREESIGLLSQLELKKINTMTCLFRKEPTPSSYIVQSTETGSRTIISANT